MEREVNTQKDTLHLGRSCLSLYELVFCFWWPSTEAVVSDLIKVQKSHTLLL